MWFVTTKQKWELRELSFVKLNGLTKDNRRANVVSKKTFSCSLPDTS